MKPKRPVGKPAIRYSEAFKMEVVRALEREGLSQMAIQKRYGIRGADTLPTWLAKYGNGTRGKVIRVETAKEINELHTLRKRVQSLERLLADASLELELERQYVNLACDRAGIKDVGEFKKKADGKRRTER